MNLLPEKKYCTGCTACYAVCSRGTITMRSDVEGFLYPTIDEGKCIKCGVCSRVCPAMNPGPDRIPLSVYAAQAKDELLRYQSSSGGVFSILAATVLSRGGIVFGAAFDRSDWHVFHRAVDNAEELSELRGSKYVQSDMGNCFCQVAEMLKGGREVLFTGTPCQIAGLKGYLSTIGVSLEKLILVDVVCHAVPSPLAWKRYLENRVEIAYPNEKMGLKSIKRIAFRRKDYGWKRFSISLKFTNDMEYRRVFNEDTFMRGFLVELFNRPSCHNCPCRNLCSGSDLTIGDYWGVASKFPEMDDDKGCSLMIVNTKKGSEAFHAILCRLKAFKSDFPHACRGNTAIIMPTKPHRNRGRFFKVTNSQDFDRVSRRLLLPSFGTRLRVYVGLCLKKIRFR